MPSKSRKRRIVWEAIIGLALAGIEILFIIFALQEKFGGDWLWPLGFCIFVVYVVYVFINKELTIQESKGALPDLKLGEPKKYPNEYITRHKIINDRIYDANSYQMEMYRIPVVNDGGRSPEVTVKLMKSEPPLPGGTPNIILHHTGDNPEKYRAYERSFPVGGEGDDTEWVDVIAVDKSYSNTKKCFIYTISAPDSMLEMHLGEGTHVFTLQAIAEKSSLPVQYQVDINMNGVLLNMKRL